MAFLENILYGNQYVGIEYFSSSNNEDRLAFLEVQKSRNELTIKKKEIADAFNWVETQKIKSPVSLVVNSAQVLQKEVAGVDPNDRKLLHKAFPNINLDDFYYEIWRNNSISIISVCRKKYVDELINNLNKEIPVSGISLGVCALSQIKDFGLPEVISTNSQTVALNAVENTLTTSVTIPETEYNINGLQLSNRYLLAFCGILRSLLNNSYTTGSINELSERLQEEYKQRSIFQKGFKTTIGIILILLLINFFLFSHFFDEVAQMNQLASINKSEIESVTALRKRVKDKEERLASFTTERSAKSSQLINDLVKDIPSSILLSEITYNPLEKKIKESEPVIFNDDIINVSGITLSNPFFTEWVSNLEKMDAVDHVTIISFGKDESNKTVFNIRLTMKR